MKNGICPKCSSKRVYTDQGQFFGGFVIGTLMIDNLTFAKLEHYVCADCGYMEAYVLHTEQRFEISQKWQLVTPPVYDENVPHFVE